MSTNPNRVLQLAHELIETLDAAGNRRIDGISASDKAKGAD